MARNWDVYTRHGLDIALNVSSFGFYAAKASTRLGFSVARGIATAAASVTSFAVDNAVFGGNTVTSPILHSAVSTVFTVAEQCTLAPIYLGEYITSTSVLAAHGSINALSVIFPGSSEASFSLASFVQLVRREWSQAEDPQRPEKHYGLTKVVWAIVGWVSLQGVTQEWQEKRWFKHLREIDVNGAPEPRRPGMLSRKPSRVRVTSDVIFPGQGGAQIITAAIGEDTPPSERRFLKRTMSRSSIRSMLSLRSSGFTFSPMPEDRPELPELLDIPNPELKANFRRFSKLVLAGYGGASLWFFGISPSQLYPSSQASTTANANSNATGPSGTTLESEKVIEEAKLATAIDASEAEAAGEATAEDTPGASSSQSQSDFQYSWWDILLGKHDQEIFENTIDHSHGHDKKHHHSSFSSHPSSSAKAKARLKALNENTAKANMKARAVIGNQHLMPRFWILTDYNRMEVVVVIRGTMSLNEIAADLTCEPDWFEPAKTPAMESVLEHPRVPGQFLFPPKPQGMPGTREGEGHGGGKGKRRYHVHGGMLKLARLMGDVGRPVHAAVEDALNANPDFDLVLCGHSLGAGVAALLGMIWADPETCLTVPSSGLPVGRNVQVYCYAPPALTDDALSRLADKLIVSFVYSHDIVARLSLGAIRDLRNAAMWLCAADEAAAKTKAKTKGESGLKQVQLEEGYSAISERARRWKAGKGEPGDMEWFIAMRKSLEANMRNCDMYPPGRVFWAVRDEDLHPSHQKYSKEKTGKGGKADESEKARLRLFEVLDVKEVFSQVVFAQNMLSSHMPHQYDRILHELL